jgi:hypothetical protein
MPQYCRLTFSKVINSPQRQRAWIRLVWDSNQSGMDLLHEMIHESLQ